MKMLRILGVLALSLQLHASDIQGIYDRAAEMVQNHHSGEDEEKLLFNFYTQEIEKLDLDVLKQNPELIFRRAMAWLDVLTSDVFEVKDKLPLVLKDFEFVLDNAFPESRLYAAAKSKKDFIDYVMGATATDLDGLRASCLAYFDQILSQWATDPTATGTRLREDLILNFKNSPEREQSFFDYLLLSSEDPELALGRVVPEKIEILGLVPLDETISLIHYRIRYQTGNTTITYETAM